MKKKSIRRILIGLAVCLMITMSPIANNIVIGDGYSNAATVSYTWPLKVSNPKGKITEEVCHKTEKSKWRKYSREWPHYSSGHFGIDFGVKSGTAVYACADGTVVYTGSYSAYGKTIVIKQADNRYSLYAHLSSISVSKNKKVRQGTYIGKSGKTGHVYGACLHFGIYKKYPIGINEISMSKAQLYKTVEDPLKLIGNKPVTTTHTINFNTNGGSGSFGTIKVQDGKGFTIPTAKPTKAGYTFVGWNAKRLADQKYHTNEKGWVTWSDVTKYKYTPSVYKSGAKHNMDNSWMKGSTKSNYTFYAKWTPNKYTVQYKAEGGTGTMNQITVDATAATSSFGAVNKFQKIGYTFNGWHIQKIVNGKTYWIVSDGNSWKWKENAAVAERKYYRNVSTISFGRNSVENGATIVMWATWKANTFTVKYDANGGEGSMQDTSHTYGVNKQLAANTFTKEGYLFKGWYLYDARQDKWLYENGTSTGWYKEGCQPAGYGLKTYPDKVTIARTTAENNGMLILSAVWEEDPDYVSEEQEESVETVEDFDQESENDDDPCVDSDEDQGEDIEDDFNDCTNDDCDHEDDEMTDAEEQNDVQEGDTDDESTEPVYAWTTWSEFSTTKPTTQDNRQIETRTEYRYRDKQFVTSGKDSLSGYTKESTKTDSPVYGAWSTSSKSGSTTVTDAKKSVVTVENKTVQKSLAHYCKCKKVCWRNSGGSCKYCGGKTNYGVIAIYSSKSLASSGYKKDTDGSYFLPTTVKVNSPDKLGTIYYMTWQGKSVNSFTTGSTVGSKNTFVWPSGTATVSRTKTVNSVNTFSKWGSWSNWSTSQYSGNNNRQVESRVLYRYRDYVQQ